MSAGSQPRPAGRGPGRPAVTGSGLTGLPAIAAGDARAALALAGELAR